jgi:uncharacterized membrane protein
MARTFFHKLESSLRIRLAFALFAIAFSVAVVVITGNPGTGALVGLPFAFVISTASYRHERSSLKR